MYDRPCLSILNVYEISHIVLGVVDVLTGGEGSYKCSLSYIGLYGSDQSVFVVLATAHYTRMFSCTLKTNLHLFQASLSWIFDKIG